MFYHPIICLQLLLIGFRIWSLEMFLESADEQREELTDQIKPAIAELERLYQEKTSMEMLYFV